MKVKPVFFGIATYIPGFYRSRRSGTGGTISPRYCYSVWLRHLVMAHKYGLITSPSRVIAELGPGDSLGIGIAALISGAENYYAFDMVKHATTTRNMDIFDELVRLFKQREDIPDEEEFPEVRPLLDSYKFPEEILTDELLARSLEPQRIEFIRKSISGLDNNEQSGCIFYVAPWYSPHILSKSSVDMILSQAVLEHVDELDLTYQAMYSWLKLGGIMSHTVDFRSHGITAKWNGHWTYSRFMWRLVRGSRPYLLNRQPYSTHVRLMKAANFEILCAITTEDDSGITRKELASPFKDISDQDLTTRDAFFIAAKRNDAAQ